MEGTNFQHSTGTTKDTVKLGLLLRENLRGDRLLMASLTIHTCAAPPDTSRTWCEEKGGAALEKRGLEWST